MAKIDWKSASIYKLLSEISFLTDKGAANTSFQYNTAGFGSLIVPTCYALYAKGIPEVSNGGTTLSIPDGNAQFIYFNLNSRAISLAKYDSTTHLTDSNYKIVGIINNASKYICINADVYVDGNILDFTKSLTKTNAQEFIFDPLRCEMIVDAYGVEKYVHSLNGGLASIVDNSLQITAQSGGYSGIFYGAPSPIVVNKEYYVYLEVRKISGQDATWCIGDPRYVGGNVSFVPLADWQIIQGKFNTAIDPNYGLFICSASEAITNEIIQVRNVFIKQRTAVEQDHEDRLIVLEGGTPPVFDLQNEVNTKENVFVPIGIHTLNSTLVIPTGRKIYGVRGKSIIQAGATLTRLIEIDGKTDVSLENLTIKGTGANTTLGGAHNGPLAGVVDTFAGAVTEANKGTKTGIYLNASERINIRGCEISNFDAYGLHDLLCGKVYEYGIKISDNYFHDNYCNLKLESEAEYSSFTGNSFTLAQIGIRCESGNNIWASNHIDKNRVGLVMTAGYNNSHGSFIGCTFNHNTLFGICLDSLSAGEVFSGCQHFYGDIYVKNSKGIVFIGGELGSSVFADGNFAGGGMWMMTGMIVISGSINHNYLGNLSDLRLKNNHKADGSDSASFNN